MATTLKSVRSMRSRVLRLTDRQQQAPREHHRAHGRAGLGVGAVGRQHPVLAVRLGLVVRSLTAGQICPPGNGIGPLHDQRVQQLGVLGLHGEARPNWNQ